MKAKMSFLLIFVFAFPLLLSACGPAAPGPCDVDKVQAASKQLMNILGKWQDAYKVASSTSRIGLAAPVQNMQSIKRDTEALEVPTCLTTARGYLSDHMNSTIDGFLAFMAQKDDSTVQSHFDAASNLLSQYTDEMNRIAACAPNCK